MSKPVTGKPARASSRASVRPTYPRPSTPTRAAPAAIRSRRALVVFILSSLPGSGSAGESALLHLAQQCLVADLQSARGLDAMPAHAVEDLLQGCLLRLARGPTGDLAQTGTVIPAASGRAWRGRDGHRRGQRGGQGGNGLRCLDRPASELLNDLRFAAERNDPLDDVFQLADVAAPDVVHEQL